MAPLPDGGELRAVASLKNPHWEPHVVNEPRQQDILDGADAAGLKRDSVLDSDHPHARWSAFAEGRLQQTIFKDNGWASLAGEDFGLAVIHAFGPDGFCFKYTNVYTDSTCVMPSKSGAKNSQSTSFKGIK